MKSASLPAAAVLSLCLVMAPDRLLANTASGSSTGAEARGQHAGHAQEKPADTSQPAQPDPKPAADDQHVHGKPEGPRELPSFIPRLTDEDRRAAFPDVEDHAVHDRAINYFILFDQLEWTAADDTTGIGLDTTGWIGRDRDRVWFRAEGDTEEGEVGEAQAHVLYGRQFSRWWDFVGGIRQDFDPGAAQTWAAFGVQGLAPYWFEVEATAYVGGSGRTQARLEVEYELLFTNTLVLQPLIELEVSGKSDPERGIGSGLSTTNVGFRLRYEIRRELAPYVGVNWTRKYGKTADFARDEGEETSGAQLLAGVRLWF